MKYLVPTRRPASTITVALVVALATLLMCQPAAAQQRATWTAFYVACNALGDTVVGRGFDARLDHARFISRLSNNFSYCHQPFRPTVSPDRKRLLYIEKVPDPRVGVEHYWVNVYDMDPDSKPPFTTRPFINKNYMRIVLGSKAIDSTHYFFPTFSPDGTRIAYVVRALSVDLEWQAPYFVATTDAQGRNFKLLGGPLLHTPTDLDWSRSGESLLVVHTGQLCKPTRPHCTSPADRRFRSDIVRINATSGQQTVVYRGHSVVSSPSEGSIFVLPSITPRTKLAAMDGTRLKLMNPDGTQVQDITPRGQFVHSPRFMRNQHFLTRAQALGAVLTGRMIVLSKVGGFDRLFVLTHNGRGRWFLRQFGGGTKLHFGRHKLLHDFSAFR